jgi:predicted transcriptional regulator
MNSYGSDIYKLNFVEKIHVDHNLSSVVTRLGDREHQVLTFILNNILPSRRMFKTEDVWKSLGIKKDSASRILRQLTEKGFLKRISTGFYEITEKLMDFINGAFKLYRISEGKRNKKNNNNNGSIQRKVDHNLSRTNPPHRFSFDLYNYGVGGSSGGYFVFLDNVRGVSVSGNYVYGDRGRRLSFIDVSLNMDRVDYAEFGVKKVVGGVSDSLLPGVFVFYSNPVAREIYFEFRPYSGVIPRDDRGSLDLSSGLRLMWSFFFRVFVELYRLLSSKKAPHWIRKMIETFMIGVCKNVCE